MSSRSLSEVRCSGEAIRTVNGTASLSNPFKLGPGMALCLQLDRCMTALGVHRIIERQSAVGGDRVAIESDDLALTYRELNQRANGVARDLISRGLRRNSHVVVRMERSPELAIALLAILKAGAAYTWIDAIRADGRWPYGMSLLGMFPLAGGIQDGIPRPILVDMSVLMTASRPAPNLPIVTRADDIACALPQPNGLPAVLVPHASIALLGGYPIPARSAWSGDAGPSTCGCH